MQNSVYVACFQGTRFRSTGDSRWTGIIEVRELFSSVNLSRERQLESGVGCETILVDGAFIQVELRCSVPKA